MFHFSQPHYLWLALALPPLAWWLWRRRRPAFRHPLVSRLQGLPRGRARVAQNLGVLARVLALACLIVALAGPRWPDGKTRVATDGITIVMVLDISGSMGERDWDGRQTSRLDAVKKVFRLFVLGGQTPDGQTLEGRPADLIGLVTFAKRPETPCPPTLSHSALVQIVEDLKPRSDTDAEQGGQASTNISDGLLMALKRAEDSPSRRKVLVLLSDGDHRVHDKVSGLASGLQPREAAQLAADLGIPVYTIFAVPSESQTTGEGNSQENPIKTMTEIAAITGGKFYQASDSASLLEVYRDLDNQERQKIQSFQYRRYHEGFLFLGLASLGLFVFVTVMEMTFWLRSP